MSQPRARRLVPTLASIAAVGSPLIAAETDVPVEAAATVSVSATLLADDPLIQPYAFYRHDREDLDTGIGRTPLDRLNYKPGVFIQRTAPAQASPFIRGLTGEQSLLLVDGIRLSHATMRPGPNQYAALIPNFSIDHIDAVLGPSAAATGSDGLTGLVDICLAEAGRDATEALEPWLRTRVDSANGVQGSAGIDGRRGDWAYSLEVGAEHYHNRIGGKDADDHLAGGTSADHAIPNTAYDQYAIAGRLAYTGIADHVIDLKVGFTTQDEAPRPDGYQANSGKTDRISRYFDPHSYTYVHIGDSWSPESIAWLDKLDTTVWYHENDERQVRERVRGPGYRLEVKDDITTGFGVKTTASMAPIGSHTIQWGVDLSFESTDNTYARYEGTSAADAVLVGTGNASTRTTVPDGSDYQTMAIFGQDSWQVNDQWDVLIGARFSMYSWEADVAGRSGFDGITTVDGDTSDISGGVRVSYQASDDLQLWGGLGKAFRAPNLTNLTGTTDRGSSGIEVSGNPDLDAEVSYTAEVGGRWLRDQDLLQVAIFVTQVDDLIQPVYTDDNTDGIIDTNDSGVMTNAEGADLAGIELSWDYGLPSDYLPMPGRLAIVGSASLVDAEVDLTQGDGSVLTDKLSRANRLYGVIGLRFDAETNWWAKVQTRWHDSYDDVAQSDSGDVRLTMAGNADGSLPGYAVLDLAGGWRSDDGKRDITLFAENIFDRTYREPGSGADAAGLSIGIEAGIRF